jgi:ATP-binding cassette subfamily C (CFTR/MRP) protein 1
VRSASEVEQNIVSVERMLQYIELKPEAPYEVPETQPGGGWPSEGRVEFRCVFLSSAQYHAYSLMQGLLVEISSRARLGAKEYFVGDGNSPFVPMLESRTDQTMIASRRENRNLWPNRSRKVICEFSCACTVEVPIANRLPQLLLALFRILEPAEGTILIDGVDITKIGLYDLRSAMTIVPQSPDLFEGTMRENIDPVGEHQDTDIWEALKQASRLQ